MNKTSILDSAHTDQHQHIRNNIMQDKEALQRPFASAPGTPPPTYAQQARELCWPALTRLLKTPDRDYMISLTVSYRSDSTNNSSDSSMSGSHNQSKTGNEGNSTSDSGLGDSFAVSPFEKKNSQSMIWPSPVLRTPFVNNTKSLQSPLRSFFFKSSPLSSNSRSSSLTKSENAIGVRFDGTQLGNLKSPCFLSTIQNQNAPKFENQLPQGMSRKRTFGQRSPLKPYQSSTRNLTADLTNPRCKRPHIETPSKGVKVEAIVDESNLFISPVKLSQPGICYNDMPTYGHPDVFYDADLTDIFGHTHYPELVDPVLANHNFNLPIEEEPSKISLFKNKPTTPLPLSLNSADKSLRPIDSNVPGSMSCSTAVRVKVPQFSSRAKDLIYGRTPIQQEITRQANSYWTKKCQPGYKTNIPLCNTLEEFSKIDWLVRKRNPLRMRKIRHDV